MATKPKRRHGTRERASGEYTPGRDAAGEWGGWRQQLLVKEKALTRSRDALAGRTPTHALAGCGQEVEEFRRAQGQGKPAPDLFEAASSDRLSRLLRARGCSVGPSTPAAAAPRTDQVATGPS